MHAHEKRVCMNSWQQHWQQQLAEREQRHLLRRVRILDSAQGADVEVDGKRYQSFISNDYLGFANHPALKKALADGAEKYGAGSGASHLLGGHSRAHQQLAGRFFEEDGVFYVKPDSTRINQDIAIPPQNRNGAKHGQMVVVGIDHYPDHKRVAVA